MSSKLSETMAREILGVSSGADYKEIKKAHRTLVGLFHPDRADSDAESQAKAHVAMTRINEAWSVIEKRQNEGILGSASSVEGEKTFTNTWNFSNRRPNKSECSLCGSTPAQHFHIRGVVSALLAIGWPNYEGTLCKSCALAVNRNILRTTMTRGWWGIGIFVIPFLLLDSVFQSRKIRKMREPAFRDLRVITPYDLPLRAQKNPLRQLTPMASSIAALTIVIAFVTSTIYQSANQPAVSSPLQTCWSGANSNNSVSPLDCSDPSAVYQTIGTVTVQGDCPSGTTEELAANASGQFTCLGPK